MQINKARIESIRDYLEAALDVAEMDILDESHLHVGHAGAADGRGHFKLTIRSKDFHGLSSLQRHRLVYAALDELMNSDIHALKIKAHDLNE